MSHHPHKKRILTIIGTRPEAIKLAPVIKALQNEESAEVFVCATGQHTDMMFPILDWFDVKRDFTLDVMKHQQPLSHLAGKLLSGLFDVMEHNNPDIVVVQGDTTSTFIGGLAAYYSFDHFWKNKMRTAPIQIAHVEAGLRTGNNYSPYPEELNRRLISHMCHWNFIPTHTAAAALHNEGITKNIYITGNTVIDALLETCEILEKTPRDPVSHIPQDEKIVLITTHRRENYGTGLQNICTAIKTLAQKYHDQKIHFVCPVHLNQHIQGPVREMLGGISNVHLIAPLHYPDFVALMRRCSLILTDSGGVQEEAPSLGKPVLIMREYTERPEAVATGTAKLVGTKADDIIRETIHLLENQNAYEQMAKAANPYGDGRASARIANLLLGRDMGHGL